MLSFTSATTEQARKLHWMNSWRDVARSSFLENSLPEMKHGRGSVDFRGQSVPTRSCVVSGKFFSSFSVTQGTVMLHERVKCRGSGFLLLNDYYHSVLTREAWSLWQRGVPGGAQDQDFVPALSTWVLVMPQVGSGAFSKALWQTEPGASLAPCLPAV